MNVVRCRELFLTDRKISGCSEATIRFYEYVVGKFLRFIEENNLDSTVESTHQHILPFFSHLQQQDLSPSTYHTLFRGLRAFTRFLYHEGYAKAEIRLPKVKQPHTTISPLNRSQMKAILHSFDTKTYLGLRNYTIIRMHALGAISKASNAKRWICLWTTIGRAMCVNWKMLSNTPLSNAVQACCFQAVCRPIYKSMRKCQTANHRHDLPRIKIT